MSNAYSSRLGASAVLPTGDAVEANVLAGKTFSNALGTGKTGTMVNNGAVTQTIAPGGSYTIPEGYHNGSGVVSASQATPQTLEYTITGSESSNTFNVSFVIDGNTICTSTGSHAGTGTTATGTFTFNGQTHTVELQTAESSSTSSTVAGIQVTSLKIDNIAVMNFPVHVAAHASSGSVTGYWNL